MPYISIMGNDYGATTQVSSVKQGGLGFKKLLSSHLSVRQKAGRLGF